MYASSTAVAAAAPYFFVIGAFNPDMPFAITNVASTPGVLLLSSSSSLVAKRFLPTDRKTAPLRLCARSSAEVPSEMSAPEMTVYTAVSGIYMPRPEPKPNRTREAAQTKRTESTVMMIDLFIFIYLFI